MKHGVELTKLLLALEDYRCCLLSDYVSPYGLRRFLLRNYGLQAVSSKEVYLLQNDATYKRIV